jgi:hypothetical protein
LDCITNDRNIDILSLEENTEAQESIGEQK